MHCIPFSTQKRIQNQVQHLRWSFCENSKQLKAFRCLLLTLAIFAKKRLPFRCMIGFCICLCNWSKEKLGKKYLTILGYYAFKSLRVKMLQNKKEDQILLLESFRGNSYTLPCTKNEVYH